jgi:TcpE family
VELPTYTNIWKIEKRLYKLYDFRLPMPLPVGQIAAFLAIAVPYTVLLTMIGMPFSHTWLWVYILPPGVLAWLVTRPVLEGKRLPELVRSQARYLSEPKTWCRLAPLAERDEVVLTARVWRSVRDPRPAERAADARAAEPAFSWPAAARPWPAIAPAAVPDAAAAYSAPEWPAAPHRGEIRRPGATGPQRRVPRQGGEPARMPLRARGADPARPGQARPAARRPPAAEAAPAAGAASLAEPQPAIAAEPAAGPRPAAAPSAVGPPPSSGPAAPDLPRVPDLTRVPDLPRVPGLPAVPAAPGLPAASAASAAPDAPALPSKRPAVRVSADSSAVKPLNVIERALRNSPGTVSPGVGGLRGPVVVVPGGHRPGKPDQVQRDRARATLALSGPARTVVLGCTAGAGQTITTLLAGQLLASMRGEAVAVVDLGSGPTALTEQARFIPALMSSRRAGAGSGSAGGTGERGLQVVTAADSADDPGQIISAVAARYPLTLADPEAAYVPRALRAADQLILVAPASAEAAGSLAMTIEWLEAHGFGALAAHAIVVLNGVSPQTAGHAEKTAAVASGRSRAIVRVPWDERIRSREPLATATIHAYTALAGVLVAAYAEATPAAAAPAGGPATSGAAT